MHFKRLSTANREIAPSKDAPHGLAQGRLHGPVGEVDVEHEHPGDQGVADERHQHARLPANLYFLHYPRPKLRLKRPGQKAARGRRHRQRQGWWRAGCCTS